VSPSPNTKFAVHCPTGLSTITRGGWWRRGGSELGIVGMCRAGFATAPTVVAPIAGLAAARHGERDH